MQVVNVKDVKRDAVPTGFVYCGRSKGWWGEGSIMGNPFSHLGNTAAAYKVRTREEAIAAYKSYLWAVMNGKETVALPHNDIPCLLSRQQVLDFLEALTEDSVLGCHCKPLACHCDVIAAAWAWWHQQQ